MDGISVFLISCYRIKPCGHEKASLFSLKHFDTGSFYDKKNEMKEDGKEEKKPTSLCPLMLSLPSLKLD